MLWTSRPTSSATSLLAVSSRDSPGTHNLQSGADVALGEEVDPHTDPARRIQPARCTSLQGRPAVGPAGSAVHQTPGRSPPETPGARSRPQDTSSAVAGSTPTCG